MGDSFLAAMVWSPNRGGKFDETLRYAVASASLLAEGTRLCGREQRERIHRELELARADIVSVT